MIREIKMNEVEEVAKYAFELNSIPEHNCKSFSTKYEEILSSFKKDIQNENDYLLGYYIDDLLEGVVSILSVPNDNYVQTTGGFFAKENFHEISAKFFNWIKEKFKGYYFYSAYSQENVEAIKFCENQNLECSTRAYFLRIEEDKFRPSIVNTKIELLTEKYHKQFTELHNIVGKDAFWNSEKILSGRRFDVYIALDNDKVIGEFAVTRHLPEGEVCFLGVKEGVSIKVLSDLVMFATRERFAAGAQTMAYVECNSVVELNIYFNHGYHIGETSIGYETKEL